MTVPKNKLEEKTFQQEDIQPTKAKTTETDELEEFFINKLALPENIVVDGNKFKINESEYKINIERHRPLNYKHLISNGFFVKNPKATITKTYL